LSLFPFLNILFGLIAVLILHIFFIIQGSVTEGSAKGRAERAGRNPEVSQELERGLYERSRTLRDQVAAAERQRRQAEAELEQRRLLLKLRQRQEKMPAAGRGTAGVPIGAPAAAEWRMIPITKGGIDNDKSPILVEVCAEGYVVHEFRGKTHETKKLPGLPALPPTKPGGPQPSPIAEPKLREFLDSVNSRRRDQYLLFLIRPEGIESFRLIRRYCEEHFPTRLSENLPRNASPSRVFDFGYEPFSDKWLLVGKAGNP
jgi:hypothetical protein